MNQPEPSIAEQRRTAAFSTIEPTLENWGEYLPTGARLAVVDAVLEAIRPYAEHCIHYRTAHRDHHDQPVNGCPWCAAEVKVQAVPTRGLL
ncbi:hypothetical protein ACFUIZ_18930 [Streptomyces cinereoruber]|uniref:hypothetical protein n=1 Tax=Streptomyces cinereoruber TaxID=67260 RepID=UPI00363AEF49